MALQFSRVLEMANAAEDIANQAATLHSLIHQFLEHNSDLGIDWTAGSTPAYISEETSGPGTGNILGKPYTRQNVGNIVSTLDNMRKLLTNVAPTQGDHLSNLNLLAKPLG